MWSNGKGKNRRDEGLKEVWVGGGRTYRGEVDTAEISGGFQASQYKLGMHTILNTQSPFSTYSLGALSPPT